MNVLNTYACAWVHLGYKYRQPTELQPQLNDWTYEWENEWIELMTKGGDFHIICCFLLDFTFSWAPNRNFVCVACWRGKIAPYTKDSRDDSAKEMGSVNADAQEVFDLTIDDMKQPSEAKEDMSQFEGEFDPPGAPVISLHLFVLRLHRLISRFSLILHHFCLDV